MRNLLFLLAVTLSGCGKNSGDEGSSNTNKGNGGNQNEECSDISCMPENYVPSQLNKGTFVPGCQWRSGEVLVDDICGRPLISIGTDGFVSFGREGTNSYLFKAHPDKSVEIFTDESFGVVESHNEYGFRFPSYPQLTESLKIPFYVMRVEIASSSLSEVMIGTKISDDNISTGLDIFGVTQQAGFYSTEEVADFCGEVIQKFESLADSEYVLDLTVNTGDEEIRYCTARIKELNPGAGLRKLWTFHATWKCLSPKECYFNILSYGWSN